ncbi:MAG: 23S rRNA (guanosine(2251)-2'-O)-methyltransferase RlmB [Alphaproteobacteria bacterium]|nr:23S rRNA (guanosine(2251)-2'-O)-methyltransferase RlmB [Alphaproteobacteria bacterium]
MSKRKQSYKGKSTKSSGKQGKLWLYGRHAVNAALLNEKRQCVRLLVTAETENNLPHDDMPAGVTPEIVSRHDIERFVPVEAVHQGMALMVEPLPAVAIEDVCNKAANQKTSVVVMLDQVTDPHNVGAIMRSAAAFEADAVIIPDRNAPQESGALAKSASGSLEILPLVRVSNLSRALQVLKQAGYWSIGLDGNANEMLGDADAPEKVVVVMGAEGKGLRKLTEEHCDYVVKLPISTKVESLNVSNAAAITLYKIADMRS